MAEPLKGKKKSVQPGDNQANPPGQQVARKWACTAQRAVDMVAFNEAVPTFEQTDFWLQFHHSGSAVMESEASFKRVYFQIGSMFHHGLNKPKR